MKIVHVVHDFPPAFYGGTEIYVVAIAKAQIEAGHDVVVVAGTDERDIECRPIEHEFDGIRVVRMRRFPRPLMLVTDTYDPILIRRFGEWLEAERPDVLHVHHWFNLTTSLVAVGAELGIPSVLSFHDLFAICPRFFRYRPDGTCPEPTSLAPCEHCCDEDYPFPAWEREADYALRTAEIARDATIARRHVFPSNAHRDTLAPLLPSPAEKVTVVPHGLPAIGCPRPGEREPVAAFGPERPLRLGYWGNAVRAKGVIRMLDAAATLTDEGRAVTVDLWGDVLEPGMDADIDAYASRFTVRRHGPYARESLPEIGGLVDVGVFVCALRESYSFTVDEAAWLRLPVVVSDRGAPRERVGDAGLVVSADGSAPIADALRTLYDSPHRLASMAAAAVEPPPAADAGLRLVGLYEEVRAEGVEPPAPVDPAPRLEHWFRRICARESWLKDLGAGRSKGESDE